MTTETAVRAASLFWAASHAIGATTMFVAWRLYRERFYLYFALSWVGMTLWGLTVGGGRLTQVFNGVFIPVATSCMGLLALYSVSRCLRRRTFTIYTAKDGSMYAAAGPVGALPKLYPTEDDIDTEPTGTKIGIGPP